MSELTTTYLLTSESVSEGHPDKVADQISDAVLDYVLKHDAFARVACETFIGPGYCVIGGEVSAQGLTLEQLREALPDVAKGVLRGIGYSDEASGFPVETASYEIRLGLQSPEIANQVAREDGQFGAGDQGLMFGYASDETEERMPLPSALSHRLLRRLADVRKDGTLSYLLPDTKSQVTVRYVGLEPVAVDTVVIASQHTADVSLDQLREDILREVIKPVLGERWLQDETRVLINHAGSFVLGGPAADTGLTGRKIIVDTYGGSCPHGGGAFSGKDATKVDRSAAYASRWVARHLVDSGLARRATVQVSYAIGSLQPISILVNTNGTGVYSDEVLADAVTKTFDLSPKGIIEGLNLRQPRFQQTAAYGHFGRAQDGFDWDLTPHAEALRANAEALSPKKLHASNGAEVHA